MLTPALRDISPLFRSEEKPLKAIYHSYILRCFHKLKATPSCPSPCWAWSRARHNIVSFLTEAPEERGLFFSRLALTDLQTQLFSPASRAYSLKAKEKGKKKVFQFRVELPAFCHRRVHMLKPVQPRPHPEAVNHFSSSPCLYQQFWQQSPGSVFCFLFPPSASSCLRCME